MNDSLPTVKLTPELSTTMLTLIHGATREEFVLTAGQLDLWQLDEFISKLIASEIDKQDLRNKLSGKS